MADIVEKTNLKNQIDRKKLLGINVTKKLSRKTILVAADEEKAF